MEVKRVKQQLLKTMGSFLSGVDGEWTADITSGPKNVLARDQALNITSPDTDNTRKV